MASSCPPGAQRGLTTGERALVRSVFGEAVDCSLVRIKRRKWFPLQPRNVVMAPWGHIHFHPLSPHYRDDFGTAALSCQGLFIHEMTHVWQSQTRGWWYLPLCRNFSRRYDYRLVPGWPLERYGIEQQAEIVRHAFLLRNGAKPTGAGDPAAYEALTRFPGAADRKQPPRLS